MMFHRLILALATLFIASPASAEVADKGLSVSTLWAGALGLNVAALLLEVVRPRLGLGVVPIAAVVAWAGHMELSDPYVGPALLYELGPDYPIVSYGSSAVGTVGPLVVVLLCRVIRRRKAQRPQ